MAKLTKTALRRKQPVTDELLIPADDNQTRMLADARSAVKNAEQGLALQQMAGESDAAEVEKRLMDARVQLDEVKDAIRKTGISITLVGVGRVRWDELLLEHPPTDEQKEKAEKDGEEEPLFNPSTLWPALLAASVPDSDLTAEDWRKEVFESKAWGPAELKELRDRASAVNQRSRILELGN